MTTTTKYLPIITLFQQAATRLKYPRIKAAINERTPVCLKLSGERAKIPGSITVTSGHEFGDPDGTFYGRIMPDGSWEQHYAVQPIHAAMLLGWLDQLASDPAKVALQYSKRDCSCMFCGRPLETNESRHNGYGPVCAEKWNLPWGEEYKTAKDAEQLAEL